ncbi:glucan biosynthesis protein [Idiomarina xiamenensis]|uniref:Glucan biosynthesis protein G n=1 Tax=Idiomarina xiamenensis 10-D-4 TaxID=740709 RepID=K2KMY7_9GAMM|nr:glucan biosynthesis protein G [Idiomarina xiamenensis]EKE83819.1 glucan biosynthesis protein G [Idiomarina xiamenensis 10-D-4]
MRYFSAAKKNVLAACVLGATSTIVWTSPAMALNSPASGNSFKNWVNQLLTSDSEQAAAAETTTESQSANPSPDTVDAEPPLRERFFETLQARAQNLAEKDYQAPAQVLPKTLTGLDYTAYRSIRFKTDNALWHDQSPFEIQLFHPGFLYREPVAINEITDNEQAVPFSTDYFNYDKPAPDLAQIVSEQPDSHPEKWGFSGFRVHYPLNDPDYKDEFLVFQGASYFRLIGPSQSYGLSARGLAVDTATAKGEEFPRFREFWLQRPDEKATSLVIYALLDSPSVTGAYKFEVFPSAPTQVLVDAHIYARRDIGKLGVAPLTSMYLHGENSRRFSDDYRPEVHDSDGLLLHTSHQQWIWRPLTNPKNLSVVTLSDTNPRGFGLLQRDRDFDNYLDLEAVYEKRPGLWVEPLNQWGEGAVELLEIPTDTEVNDNIGAYWVPKRALKAGDSRYYRYMLTSVAGKIAEQQQATVTRTRIGRDLVPNADGSMPPASQRQFTIDFSGGQLATLGAKLPLTAQLQLSNGEAKDVQVQRLPANAEQQGAIRVAFKLLPGEADAVDMQLFVHLRGQPLTETWNYVWRANAVE